MPKLRQAHHRPQGCGHGPRQSARAEFRLERAAVPRDVRALPAARRGGDARRPPDRAPGAVSRFRAPKRHPVGPRRLPLDGRRQGALYGGVHRPVRVPLRLLPVAAAARRGAPCGRRCERVAASLGWSRERSRRRRSRLEPRAVAATPRPVGDPCWSRREPPQVARIGDFYNTLRLAPYAALLGHRESETIAEVRRIRAVAKPHGAFERDAVFVFAGGDDVDPPSDYTRGTPRRGRDPPSTAAPVC